VDHEHQSLRGLGNAVILLLSAELAVLASRLGVQWLPLPWHLIGRLDAAGNALTVLTGIVFVMWFRRARINAVASGWRQRRAVGWTFWGWLVPVASLFVPFQLMGDIWRASLPEDRRRKVAWLPGLWWTCFLAGCVTKGVVHATAASFAPYLYPTMWWWSLVLLGASAALLVVIVGRVTDSPIG
jgi:Domain of unknown function (DUF4328)